jgi:peptide deformylase
MAILKIARMGHPVLRQAAAAIEDPTAPEIHRLVADMIETMEDADGTGLAAPQVHVPLRLVIFTVAGDRAGRGDGGEDEDGAEDPEAPADEDVPLTVLINPVIEPLGEETVEGWEACLSVPDLAGRVPRHNVVRYRGLALDGSEIAREAWGFHARVVQHECDHLDGILYPQRMTDLSTLVFTSELRAAARAEVEEG